MTELEMMEAIIEEYQTELHRVYLTLIAWDTPQSRFLATQISASLPFRGEKAIRDRLAELEAENQQMRSLLPG